MLSELSNRFARRLIRIVSPCLLLVAGCSDHANGTAEPKTTAKATRTDPVAAYNEIQAQALKQDTAYLRRHLAPSFDADAKAKGNDPHSEQFLTQFQRDLAMSHAHGSTPADEADTVVIDGASGNPGLFGGSAWLFRIRMTYDRQNGWMLAGMPYDQRPVGAASSQPAPGRS